jgi:hypothetical protein
MSSGLPEDATPASQARYEITLTLAATCPEHLGREIALTGSAARGVADESSDIEVMCWTEERQPENLYVDWLRGAGATELTPAWVNEGDHSTWITCRFQGVWVELGWLVLQPFEELLGRVAAGEDDSEYRLMVAGSVARALPLRTHGLLDSWQNILSRYPDSLVGALVRKNTEVWSDPHVPLVRWALARRNHRLGLAFRLGWDMLNVLGILWAINHQWPQDWKWTDERSLDLPIAPAGLSERINRVFTFDPPEAAVHTALELIEETLLLVPREYDVSAARASIRAAMAAQ